MLPIALTIRNRCSNDLLLVPVAAITGRVAPGHHDRDHDDLLGEPRRRGRVVTPRQPIHRAAPLRRAGLISPQFVSSPAFGSDATRPRCWLAEAAEALHYELGGRPVIQRAWPAYARRMRGFRHTAPHASRPPASPTAAYRVGNFNPLACAPTLDSAGSECND